MNRLQAAVLRELQRGPYTIADLRVALGAGLPEMRKAIEKLHDRGLVNWTLDGWELARVNEEDGA